MHVPKGRQQSITILMGKMLTMNEHFKEIHKHTYVQIYVYTHINIKLGISIFVCSTHFRCCANVSLHFTC